MLTKVRAILKILFDKLFPMCPNGGHRQSGTMVTNIKGKSFCWHGDCMAANFEDVKDVEVDYSQGYLAAKCKHCGKSLRGLKDAPEIPTHIGTERRTCAADGSGALATW